MKICWDNLDQFRYNPKTGKWYKGIKAYVYKEHCQTCKEPFLSKLGKEVFCSHKCSASRNKLNIKKIKQSFSNEGYTLLEENYIKSTIKLKIQCPQGHNYKSDWNVWNRGHRCPYCSGNAKKTYEEVKQSFKNERYTLLSNKYKNWCSKLKYKCPKGHIHNTTWNLWKSKGTRCPYCSFMDGKSSTEQEILKTVKSITKEQILENNRTQILNPKTKRFLELDIWIPSIKKAIEINGRYWHSLEEVKLRDIEKHKECKRKQIELLIIDDKRWINDKQKEINRITKFLER